MRIPHLLLLMVLIFLFNSAFEKESCRKLKLPKAYVYIPSGKCLLGDEEVSVAGFYTRHGVVWENYHAGSAICYNLPAKLACQVGRGAKHSRSLSCDEHLQRRSRLR